MPQYPWLDPAAFFLPGGRTGCLLIHGYTGAPVEMRPMGEYLAERGIAVLGPCLPGHGTRPEDMRGVSWEHWYSSVEASYLELCKSCSLVFVGGFSLGALLALHLAVQRALSGLIVMSPALELADRRAALTPYLRHFMKHVPKDPDPTHSDLTDPEAYKRFWSYDVYPIEGAYQLRRLQKCVRRELNQVRCPTLVIYSTRDTAIGVHSGAMVYANVAATEKRQLVLHNSGHGIVLDTESRSVFDESYRWITAHS
jgi:carboxylesterase